MCGCVLHKGYCIYGGTGGVGEKNFSPGEQLVYIENCCQEIIPIPKETKRLTN